ncbi:Fc.00g044420.m01.CDS01 [Cosmosporella sp. VM-42]
MEYREYGADDDYTNISHAKIPRLDPPALSIPRKPQPQRRARSQPVLPSPSRTPEPSSLMEKDAGEKQADHPMDAVSLDVAKVIINMQTHYASELEAEKQRSAELEVRQEEMQKRINEMERRLQSHVVLMDGFVGFMSQVRERRFAIPEFERPETQIARSFGGDHLEAVQGLMSLTRSGSVAQPSVEEVILGQPDEEPYEASTVAPDEQLLDDDELPPTPDLEAPSVISTGKRVPKRRNLYQRRQGKAKRRATTSRRRADRWSDDEELSEAEHRPSERRRKSPSLERPQHHVRNHCNQTNGYVAEPSLLLERRELRTRSGWKAVNVTDSPIEEEPPRRDSKSDYEPCTEDEGGLRSRASSSSSLSPAPSSASEASHAAKPSLTSSEPPKKSRYSGPRKTGRRFAIGPPGRPFEYHHMPKTVALVWQEYYHGLHGNPAIDSLEREYDTGWRGGTQAALKYGSNYKAVRKTVVDKVEQMSRDMNIGVDEACRILDKKVAGRITLLIKTIKAGDDPMEVIPDREK